MEERAMPIKRKMKVSLNKAVPSGYPISKLKGQLTDLGLVCEETSEERLKEYKQEVLQSFKNGDNQIFSMMKSGQGPFAKSDISINGLKGVPFLNALGLEQLSETGSWVLRDDAGGYRQELSTILNTEHFDMLYKDYSRSFNGQKKEISRTINEPTGQVIRDVFGSMAANVMSVIPGGITSLDQESMISSIIDINQSKDLKNYELENILYSFLVNGYDDDAGYATSVGALTLQYRIHIKNYKDKNDNKSGRHNDAEMYLVARFASYSEPDILNRDLGFLKAKSTRLFAPLHEQAMDCKVVEIEQYDMPIVPSKLIVYDKLPAPGSAVFRSGLPIMAPGDYIDSIIFYRPDFENLGYVDNLDSDVETSYSKSVTVGFENSMEVGISLETSMEMDLTIVKFGFTLGINMSLTSTFNQSSTESINFTVPGGRQAYLYRGKMMTVVLRYDPYYMTYEYVGGSENLFLTNALKTTTKPIVNTQK